MIEKPKRDFYNKIHYYIYFIISVLLIIFDRITKSLALLYNFNYLGRFQRLFHLPPLKNTGMSLHIFNMNEARFFLILKIMGIIIVIYFIYRLKNKYYQNKSMIGEILVISGGIGNLIDRFYYHAVIDFIFIKIPLLNYLAIANFADIIITIGCIILLIELFFDEN
jgi:signal peptidase II